MNTSNIRGLATRWDRKAARLNALADAQPTGSQRYRIRKEAIHAEHMRDKYAVQLGEPEWGAVD